jgi:hypothetical protein
MKSSFRTRINLYSFKFADANNYSQDYGTSIEQAIMAYILRSVKGVFKIILKTNHKIFECSYYYRESWHLWCTGVYK